MAALFYQAHQKMPRAWLALGLVLAIGVELASQEIGGTRQSSPAPDPAAIDRGRITYGFYCMNCHGGDGRGGRDGGSDLTESAMLTADDGGRRFAEFLPVGRPEQRMPPTPLADDEIADLWAFLRVLVGAEAPAEPAGPSIEGDAEAGQRHFKRAGCVRCHSVARDLQGIGARLDAAAIRERLLALPPAASKASTPRAERAAADRRAGHAESVAKLSDQAVRDVAVYLAAQR